MPRIETETRAKKNPLQSKDCKGNVGTLPSTRSGGRTRTPAKGTGF